jgi:hypothetical protein
MTVRSFVAAALLTLAACSHAPHQPPEPESGLDLTGSWMLSTISPLGTEDADMTVEQTGRQLAGKVSSSHGTLDYTGMLDGNAVEFTFTFHSSGQPIKIDYAGVVEGDTMSGKVVFGELSEGTFTAKRKIP